MDELESKKRRALTAEEDIGGISAKRLRQDTLDKHSKPPAISSFRDVKLETVYKVEEMIAVPIDFIFREVPQTSFSTMGTQSNRRRPLLSRTEAQCFLMVTRLSHELDSLVATSANVFKQKLLYSSFSDEIKQCQNPFAWSLLPSLHVLGQTIPESALRSIQVGLDKLVTQLRAAEVSLRQFSEQNYSLAETVMETVPGTSGEILGREKRLLSDIQEEVANRIVRLLDENEGFDDENSVNDNTEAVVSMKEYCRRSIATSPSAGAADSPMLSLPQQTAMSLSEPRPPPSLQHSAMSSLSEPRRRSEEKENAPSQQSLAAAEEIIYGSQSSQHSESPACGGQTQNAAHVLSALATATYTDREES